MSSVGKWICKLRYFLNRDSTRAPVGMVTGPHHIFWLPPQPYCTQGGQSMPSIYWCPHQVCQKHLFLHQLTLSMTSDCSLNYEFSTRKFHAQNMLRTRWEHIVYINCSEFQNKKQFGTQHVNIFWTRNSMNNLLSDCGLVDTRISASEKDLSLHKKLWMWDRLKQKAINFQLNV